MTIFCDRQGGREHYGSLLRLMFDQWSLEVLREQDGHSDYRLRDGPNSVRIIFREKAETHCMAVALASMLSKYLREALDAPIQFILGAVHARRASNRRLPRRRLALPSRHRADPAATGDRRQGIDPLPMIGWRGDQVNWDATLTYRIRAS